ncbi:MAG TPA: hypothetical protein VMM12_09745 [Longimicrobiales bacterium]|nr:hypothetical protein [Longimicrobiales bacterium]
MAAGILRFRLCDNGFDCEHCLLDAALRGEHAAPAEPGRSDDDLPPDRLYAAGHAWLQPRSGRTGVWRAGLDPFAASLLGDGLDLHLARPDRPLRRGQPLCEIRIGTGGLAIGAPVRGHLLRCNGRLRADPGLLLTDPYGHGWIAELVPDDPAEMHDLDSHPAAAARLAADRLRFRRAAAVALLAPLDPQDRPAPDRPRRTDLHDLLGPRAYLELLRDFIR